MLSHDQSVSPYLRRRLRSYEEVLRKRRGRVSSAAGSIARPSDTGRSPVPRSRAFGEGPLIAEGKS